MEGMTASHIETAYVVSAAELKESQVSALARLLSHKLNKRVRMSLRIDPSLIGGLYIHVAGLIIDRTVKRQLSDMRDALKKGGAG